MALSSRLRSASLATPRSLRSSLVSSRRIAESMPFVAKASAYSASPSFFNQAPTSIAVHRYARVGRNLAYLGDMSLVAVGWAGAIGPPSSSQTAANVRISAAVEGVLSAPRGVSLGGA